MTDTLRNVAIEAVARTEGSTIPVRTEHAKKVAGVLRDEASKDVFTGLQIAAGEQVSPAILRANLAVSIGTLAASGTVERPAGSAYEARYTRADNAITDVEKYFDDQKSFAEFATTTEGDRVIKSTGRFLMTHPALAEYFAAITHPTQRENAARKLAEQYLQDPFTRDKVKQALLDTAINKGEVADEYSEAARKKDALKAKLDALEAKRKKLVGDPSAVPPTTGEIEMLSKRRQDYDRVIDPTTTPPTPGREFKATQDRLSEIAGLKSDIAALDTSLRTLGQRETDLNNEYKRMLRIENSGGTPPRPSTEVMTDITDTQGKIAHALGEKASKQGGIAAKEAEVKAIEEDRRQLDAKIQELKLELKSLNDEISSTNNEHNEQVIKLTKLEAAKGRAEELAVSELEHVFKKGVEQELIDRLERARDAADKALEESAARTKDINEKQYREKLAKRHKTPDGKVDGKSINEDFTGMMRPSQEYHVVKNPADPNKVYMYEKNDAGAWIPLNGGPVVGAVAGSDIYYLTGPEFSMLQMMNNTSEFDGDYLLGKLKDTEWMQTEAMNFAAKTLQDKMYASRGWLQRRRTGVKRLSSAEITKIQNSTWGVGLLEQALEQNKAHIDSLEKAMKGGALGGEVLTGPGTWKDKIARMSKAQVALLILALTASGILLGPLALPTATGAGTLIGGLGLSQSVGGAIAGGAAGIAAARARRRA